MLLYEFDDTTSIRTRLVAVTAQLRSQIEKDSRRKDYRPWTKDELQNFLAKNDLIIDDSDLFDMIKKAPLKNIISNISNNEVQFKGINGNTDGAQTEKTANQKKKTLAKMAQNAMSSDKPADYMPPTSM